MSGPVRDLLAVKVPSCLLIGHQGHRPLSMGRWGPNPLSQGPRWTWPVVVLAFCLVSLRLGYLDRACVCFGLSCRCWAKGAPNHCRGRPLVADAAILGELFKTILFLEK